MINIIEKTKLSSPCILIGEMIGTQNFGRELVFSTDFCYNDIGDKNEIYKYIYDNPMNWQFDQLYSEE